MSQTIKSTCCYCGVGCGVLIETEHGRITGVRGDPEHPANFGRLCTKGATLHLTAREEYRLKYPALRPGRDQEPQRITWNAALDTAAERFAEVIRAHGPDAVAFYISGQLMTEDYYVFNKLAKGLIGTNNVDTNSRLCMSSAVAGYKQTLGADAPPACYADIAEAGVILIAGAFFLFNRWLRIESNRRRWHAFLLRMPLVGKVVRGSNTARFARTLSTLTASTVPVLEALRISSEVVTNLPMKAAVEDAAVRVREGAPIGRSLGTSRVFPPMMIHLISSGETSGELDTMLERAAVHQERELDSILQAVVGLLGPLMILVMGGLVLVIVLAMLLPIFELNQLVK